MSDLAKQLAEKVFPLEYFLSGVRSGCEGMLKMMGEELWEVYQGELMDRVMGLYAEVYPAYFDVQVQVFDDVYTPVEITALIVIHDEYPWLNNKAPIVQRLTIERNVDNSTRMMESVRPLVEEFMEEKENE